MREDHDCWPSWLFADYISSMASRRIGGTRERVNEVYVNNEGEEMNTSGTARPSLMAGATPVGGTIRK